MPVDPVQLETVDRFLLDNVTADVFLADEELVIDDVFLDGTEKALVFLMIDNEEVDMLDCFLSSDSLAAFFFLRGQCSQQLYTL